MHVHELGSSILIRPIELRDPRRALRALAPLPHPFLLYSSLPDRRGRWSFFGADPFRLHRGGDWNAARAEWRVLARGIDDRRAGAEDDAGDTTGGHAARIPFVGGAVGYWSYDFGRRLERLPARAVDDTGLADFVVGFYDVIGAFDHASQSAWLLSSGLPLAGAEARGRAQARLETFARLLEAAATSEPDPTRPRGGLAVSERERAAPLLARSTFSRDAYRRAVEAVREHIRCGDIFQANLSQRWTLGANAAARESAAGASRATPSRIEALDLLDALGALSPAPFAAYFGAADHAVVSASPERFLELRGRRVEARPIKGTRPRGMCVAEDEQLAAELMSSAKDRAENVMIVDVLRNDLGRVCETGSISVPELCGLETFPQVFHLTSTVTGQLRRGNDAFDLLEAAFPGGSITGAPKLRAMEIIESLEPVRRHVYTGAIGYVGWNGDADWNIAIRTALVTANSIRFAAGGGITAESDPDAEYLETLHKAEGLRLGLAQLLGPVELNPAASTP